MGPFRIVADACTHCPTGYTGHTFDMGVCPTLFNHRSKQPDWPSCQHAAGLTAQ